MSPDMAIINKNDHLIYPNLAYAHIAPCNPKSPPSHFIQPPLSILKRIEDSPAHKSPPLDRYWFDVERKVLAKAKATEAHTSTSRIDVETRAREESAAARVDVVLAANAKDRATTYKENVGAGAKAAVKSIGGNELAVSQLSSEQVTQKVTASSPWRQFLDKKVSEKIRAEVSFDEIDSMSLSDDIDSASSLDEGDKTMDENKLGFSIRHMQKNGVAQRAKLAAKARAVASQETGVEACTAARQTIGSKGEKGNNAEAKAVADTTDMAISRSLEQLQAEESGALVQAAKWQRITNQSKKKSNEDDDKAAADAANWAISRSLKQLRVEESEPKLLKKKKKKKIKATKGLVARLKPRVGERSFSRGGSQGQCQKNEIRVRVETLVRRILPDEIHNVDDMMRQFEGREEELMETLQTMEDRCIAQKARTSGHELEKEKSMAATQMSLPDPKESALELAIENHDWAAADTILTLIQNTEANEMATNHTKLC